jgi:hypothetical protein
MRIFARALLVLPFLAASSCVLIQSGDDDGPECTPDPGCDYGTCAGYTGEPGPYERCGDVVLVCENGYFGGGYVCPPYIPVDGGVPDARVLPDASPPDAAVEPACPLEPGCRYGECDVITSGPAFVETCGEDGPEPYQRSCFDGEWVGGVFCSEFEPPPPPDAGVSIDAQW